jgi:hypothetical protein
MTNHNLALLSDAERADIELQKQAHLIVHQLRNTMINRAGVKKLIEASKQSERLRDLINQYRKVK